MHEIHTLIPDSLIEKVLYFPLNLRPIYVLFNRDMLTMCDTLSVQQHIMVVLNH